MIKAELSYTENSIDLLAHCYDTAIKELIEWQWEPARQGCSS